MLNQETNTLAVSYQSLAQFLSEQASALRDVGLFSRAENFQESAQVAAEKARRLLGTY